jgi:hypothetical protein
MAKNKEKALAALLNNSSVRAASKSSGLSEETLYRFLRNEDFRREYQQARRQTVQDAIGQLQSSAGEAVEALKRNLHSENPAIEIRAAQIILDNSFRGLETSDILFRLEALENEHRTQIEAAGKTNN